jgi:ribonucleotide reductase alpha subunit
MKSNASSKIVKRVFLTAFEIDPEWIIECASRRQKWIDMGNLSTSTSLSPAEKTPSDVYVRLGKGLKTNYYLRASAQRRSRSRQPISTNEGCNPGG